MATKISPQLFDLSTDIAEYVPANILEEWLKSDQTPDNAKNILKSTIVKGTLLSSDTAGLSKLTGELGLIEVMARISKPKEIIFGLCKLIGGEPIGIWAADNSQMFFKHDIDHSTILQTVVNIQRLIEKTCQVKIGIAIHTGEFYKIGNKLFGTDADLVEEIAENDTEGGEIVVSEDFMKDTSSYSEKFKTTFKNYYQTKQFFKIEVLEKIEEPKTDIKDIKDYKYPIPFSEEFLEDIRNTDFSNLNKVKILNDKYIQNKIVVFVTRENIITDATEYALLNDFTFYGLLSKAAIRTISHYEGKKIKVASKLAIFTFSNEYEALTFAKDYKEELSLSGLNCRIAIDRGEVIIFKLKDKTYDITGNPVNITSKLTEDLGKAESFYITENIYNKLNKELRNLIVLKDVNFDFAKYNYLPEFKLLV